MSVIAAASGAAAAGTPGGSRSIWTPPMMRPMCPVLTFFNKYYDRWCSAVTAFLTSTTKPSISARPCSGPGTSATRGGRGRVERLLALLRLAFPQARFLVGSTGVSQRPRTFDVLDAEPGLDSSWRWRKTRCWCDAEPAMAVARGQSEASGQTEHVYNRRRRMPPARGPRARRVVIKAEVVQLAGRAPQDTRASSSPICGRRRGSFTSGSTVPAVTSRIGSKSCTTGSRSVGPAAVASGRINCASSSPPRPMC